MCAMHHWHWIARGIICDRIAQVKGSGDNSANKVKRLPFAYHSEVNTWV